MKVGAWNCRGLKSTNSPTFPFLNCIVSCEALDFLFLSEMKCMACTLEPLASRLGFSNWTCNDSTSLSKGLFLCWSNKIIVQIMFMDNHYVCCKVTDECNELFYLVCVYGAPKVAERSQVWDSGHPTSLHLVTF